MAEFLHQLSSGFSNGCIYACLALALVLIYQSTGHVNFAQGEMAMFATYVALALFRAGVPYWVVFPASVAIAFAGGMLVQVALVRPVQNAPVLSSVAVFIGLLVVFNSVAGWIWGFTSQEFPSPFSAWNGLGGQYISGHALGVLAVTLCVMTLVAIFFRYTLMGLAMRSAAVHPLSSRLLGIPVARTLALGWGMAAAVGAVAGVLAAPTLYLDPNMMGGLLLYGFAGALLGGISNPWGAALGGVLVGLVETLAGAYVVGTELKLLVALAIIVTVLIFKPVGLFGLRTVSRV
jgi:branched-chain amino acid transport system permease protein